jgi:hypothetical protein
VTAGVPFMTLRSDGFDLYAQPDGRFIGHPGPATNVTADGPALKGATNILLGEVDHRKTACGPRAFAEIYKFIVGRAPARIAITPETEVVLNGRVTGVVDGTPTNRPVEGGRVEVYRVSAETGERQGAAPHSKATGADGAWRPAPVRLLLGVLSLRMSLIGQSRLTLNCRHGGAVWAVAPRAPRREHLFPGSSRGPPYFGGSAVETLHRRFGSRRILKATASGESVPLRLIAPWLQLAAIGLELLKDFVALVVEDAHPDRTRRPDRIRRRADRVGRVSRPNLGFSDNSWPVIAGDGKELKAELPRFDMENAFQFFQLHDL